MVNVTSCGLISDFPETCHFCPSESRLMTDQESLRFQSLTHRSKGPSVFQTDKSISNQCLKSFRDDSIHVMRCPSHAETLKVSKNRSILSIGPVTTPSVTLHQHNDPSAAPSARPFAGSILSSVQLIIHTFDRHSRTSRNESGEALVFFDGQAEAISAVTAGHEPVRAADQRLTFAVMADSVRRRQGVRSKKA